MPIRYNDHFVVIIPQRPRPFNRRNLSKAARAQHTAALLSVRPKPDSCFCADEVREGGIDEFMTGTIGMDTIHAVVIPQQRFIQEG